MKSSILFLFAISFTLLLLRIPTAESVTCNPVELSSCVGAITSPTAPPSTTCCAKLKEQEPCFCQYFRNPSLRGYITSPNAKRVAKACGVPYPTNC